MEENEKTEDILRRVRCKNGYTQKWIAEYLGISQGSYCNIESGRYDIKLGQLKSLAKLYKVSLKSLIGE